MHPRLLIALAALTASGCNPGPVPSESAFYNRGGPEQLLDTSSEVINLSIASSAERTELSKWVAKDKPSRAELYCKASDTQCTEAKKILEINHVSAMIVPSANNSVALVYDRLLARDCDPRYRDSTQDWYWKNPPEYGCSVSANIIQHVSDKQQFVNPKLMDNPRATGPVATYSNAYTSQAAQQQQPGTYDLNQSTLSQVSQTVGN